MADDADSPDLVAPPPAQEDGSAPPAPAPREGRPDLSDLPPGALMAARSALKYGVDPQVAIALAKHESGFNPNAIGVPTKSGERARGLFQVMPATAAGYGYDVNKMTPQDLADLGMKNFKIALDKHDGSYPHALAEHLGGPNAIAQDGSIRGDISDAMGSTPAGFAHSVLATAQRPDLMAGYQAQGAADVNSAMGASDQPDDGSGMDPRTKAAFDEYNANIVPPPPPPESIGGTLARGFGDTIRGTKSMSAGALAWMADVADKAVGGNPIAAKLRDTAIGWYQKSQAEEQKNAKPSDTYDGMVDAIQKDGDFGAFAHFLAYNVGQAGAVIGQQLAAGLIGGLAASAVTGGAGGIAGAVAGAADGSLVRGAIDRVAAGLVANQAEKLTAEAAVNGAVNAGAQAEIQKQAVQRAYAQIIQMGQVAGTAGFNVPTMIGATYQAANPQAGEGLEGDRLLQVGVGGTMAAVAQSITDKLGGHFIKQGGAEALSGFGRVGRVAGNAALGAATQGADMLTQTAATRWGAGQDLTGDEADSAYRNAVASGAVVGGVAGAAAGIKKPGVPEAVRKQGDLAKIFAAGSAHDAAQAALEASRNADADLGNVVASVDELLKPAPPAIGYHARDQATGLPFEGQVEGAQLPGTPLLPSPGGPPAESAEALAGVRQAAATGEAMRESEEAQAARAADQERLANGPSSGTSPWPGPKTPPANIRPDLTLAPQPGAPPRPGSFSPEAARILADLYQRRIDERGGVALPEEAAHLQAMGLPRNYDSITPHALEPVSPGRPGRAGAPAEGGLREVAPELALPAGSAGGGPTTSPRPGGMLTPVGGQRTLDLEGGAGGTPPAPKMKGPPRKVGPGIGQQGRLDFDNGTSSIPAPGQQQLDLQGGSGGTPPAPKMKGPAKPKGPAPDQGTLFSAPRAGEKMNIPKPNGERIEGTVLADTDPKVGKLARLSAAISRVFGHQVVHYDGDPNKEGGFFDPRTPDRVYINVNGKEGALAIFGHELFHAIAHNMPEAAEAFRQTVLSELTPEGAEAFKRYYGNEKFTAQGEPGKVGAGHAEEISADMLGNRMMDPEFMSKVAARMAAGGADRTSLVMKFGALVTRAVRSILKAVGGEGFESDKFVSDVKRIESAAVEMLARYGVSRQMAAREMELARLKGAHEAARVPLARVQKPEATAPPKEPSPEQQSAAEGRRMREEAGAARRAAQSSSARQATGNFEVAPDPRDTETAARWNSLPAAKRAQISDKVARAMVPKILRAAGIKGSIESQIGGWKGDQNRSYVLKVEDPADLPRAAKLIGHVFKQEAVGLLADHPFEGSDPMDELRVHLPGPLSFDELQKVYDQVHSIKKDDGEPLFLGHSTVEGSNEMNILHSGEWTGVPTEDAKQRIRDATGLEVDHRPVHGAFPSGEADASVQAGGLADVLRDEASRMVASEVGASAPDRGTAEAERQGAAGAPAEVRGTGVDDARANETEGARLSRARAVNEREPETAGPSRYERGEQFEGDTLTGTHFAPEPRRAAYSEYYGAGLRAADQGRLRFTNDDRLRHRIYFKVNKGAGVLPTAGSGRHAHEARLEGLYDANRNPEGFDASDRPGEPPGAGMNRFESQVLDHGYDGYHVRHQGEREGSAVLLDRRSVPIKHVGEGPRPPRVDLPPEVKESAGRRRDRERGELPTLESQDAQKDLERIARGLTEPEMDRLTRTIGKRLVDKFAQLPPVDELAAAAWAGRAKRGWYRDAARTIGHIWGADAPRFTALLASLSPRTPVDENLRRAIDIWGKWTKAGRPTDRDGMLAIVGNLGDAFRLNAMRALSAEDANSTFLGGPKVHSFYQNLMDHVNEVTNDTWQATLAGVSPTFPEGTGRADFDQFGEMKIKSPGYLAMSAWTRLAAERLRELTGDEWTPREVQETSWSWVKTLIELADKTKTPPDELLRQGALTDELLKATPDFATLLGEPAVTKRLEAIGLGDRLNGLQDRGDNARAAAEGSVAGREAAPFAPETQEQLTQRAAERMAAVRRGDVPEEPSDDSDLPDFSLPRNRFDGPIEARWTKDRVDRLISEHAYPNDPKKSKAYAMMVRPKDFVRATTPAEYREALREEAGPLDAERLRNQSQTPFLHVRDTPEGMQIVGHEGRHRMQALADAGVDRVPVVIRDQRGGQPRSPIDAERYFHPQDFGGLMQGQRGFLSGKMLPISYEQSRALRQQFEEPGDLSYSAPRTKNQVMNDIVRQKLPLSEEEMRSHPAIGAAREALDQEGLGWTHRASKFYDGTHENLGDTAATYTVNGAGEPHIFMWKMFKRLMDEDHEVTAARTIYHEMAHVMDHAGNGSIYSSHPDLFVDKSAEGTLPQFVPIGRVAKALDRFYRTNPYGAEILKYPLSPVVAKNMDVASAREELFAQGAVIMRSATMRKELYREEPDAYAFFKTALAHAAGYRDIARGDIPERVRQVARRTVEFRSAYDHATQFGSADRDRAAESVPDGVDADEPHVQESVARTQFGKLDPDQEAALEKAGAFRPGETWGQKLGKLRADWKMRATQGLVDEFRALRDWSPTAYRWARLAKGSEGSLEAAIMFGKPFLRDGAVDVDINDPTHGFANTLAQLKGEHQQFLWWVAGQRAALLKSMGLENLLDGKDIEALQRLNQGTLRDDGVTSRAEVYGKVLKEYTDYNNAMLDIARQSGLLSEGALAKMRDAPYVPFYRVMEDDGKTIAAGLPSGLFSQYAYRKLTGGTGQLGDLLDNTMRNWAHVLNASAKNRAAVRGIDDMVKADVAERSEPGNGAVKIMRDGQAEWYQIHDPHAAEAMGAINYVAPSYLKAFGAAKRALTWGVTVSPVFKVRTLLRETLAATAQSDISANAISNLAQGWRNTDPRSQIFASLLAGGGQIRFGSTERGSRVNAMIKRAGGATIDETTMQRWGRQLGEIAEVYHEFGNRVENVNRAALYDQLIKKGKSHEEASFMARDLLDFTASGRWPVVRFLTQTVPFMNARMQSLYALGRTWQKEPAKVGAIVGSMGLASLALMLSQQDEDWWKRREDFDRDAYWAVRVGDQAMYIPKPFELGAMATMFERTWELMFNKDMTGRRFGSNVGQTLLNTFSFDPTPQLVKPILSVAQNKDPFTQRPIETGTDQRLLPNERYDENTSMAARFLGSLGLPNPASLVQATYEPLSPKQVDYMLRAYTGSVSSLVNTALDAVARPDDKGPAPSWKLDTWSGGFLRDQPSDHSRYVEALYEQSKKVDETFATIKRAQETGDWSRAQRLAAENTSLLAQRGRIQGAEKELTDVTKQIHRVEQSTSLSAEQKRAMITRLNAQRNSIAQSAVPAQ